MKVASKLGPPSCLPLPQGAKPYLKSIVAAPLGP